MKTALAPSVRIFLGFAVCALELPHPAALAEPARKRADTPTDALHRVEHPDYRHHIVAIDEYGSAMRVISDVRPDGSARRLVLKPYASENTEHFLRANDSAPRNPAQYECDGISCHLAGKDAPYWQLFRFEFLRQMRAQAGQPDDYTRRFGSPIPESDGIFENYRRLRAAGVVDHVVIYIHGGMNFIGSAGLKACELTRPMLRDGAYPIFIIWNSNLPTTYWEHLWAIREGKHHPFFGSATLPLQLFADAGTALARAPLSLLKLGRNDAYHLFPETSPRYRLTVERYGLLRDAFLADRDRAVRSEIAVSAGAVSKDTVTAEKFLPAMDTDKTFGMRAESFASWLAWLPAKAATTPLIDTLGTSAWFNMIRRTRLMFERESFCVRPTLAAQVIRNLESDRELRWLCRQGALRLFFEAAQNELADADHRYPPITLIGHSMGAIVAGEIVARFPELPVDNLVFMAAASTVNDFKLKVAPFLARNERTHFYNLSLRTSGETGEREPSDYLEPAPRGSLLVWIDSLFDAPIAEDDRTMGRWDNALLAMDWLPGNAAGRTTIKGFGNDRRFPLSDTDALPFPYDVDPGPPPVIGKTEAAKTRGAKQKWLVEPQKHGEFTKFDTGKTCYPFWRPYFWTAEPIAREVYPLATRATPAKAKATAKSQPAAKARRPQPLQDSPRMWGR